MLFRIGKGLTFLVFFVALFSLSVKDAYAAGPVVTGKVVISGSGAPVAGVWVKWQEDFRTTYQSAYRYAQTDINGVYVFDYWPDVVPGQRNVSEKRSIDTNIDGAADDTVTYIDPIKPIPGNPTPTDDQHFDSGNNPHAFTAVVPAGWNGTFSQVTGVALNNLAGTITNPDIVFTPSTATPTPAATNIYTISGNVYKDSNENGLLDAGETGYTKGVTVSLTGDAIATVTSDASGNYSFSNVNAGNYTVTITEPSGYRATSAVTSNVTLRADTLINFGVIKKTGVGSGCTAAITGTVFNDTNKDGVFDVGETPLRNWKVTLENLDLAAPLSIQSDVNGNYIFNSLCTGSYTVTYTVSTPWVPTTQLSYTLSVLDGNIYNNNNFGANEIFDVSGTAFIDVNGNQIKDAGESPYAGATVLLSGPVFASGTTDVNGQYLFKNLPVGSYVISVVMPPGTKSTTPNYLNIVNLTTDRTINFGFDTLTATPVSGKCSSNGTDFIILFDHSGSMNDPDPASGQEKLKAAKAASNAFVGLIAQQVPGSQVGVVEFSSSDNFPNDPTATAVVAPLSTNYSQIQAAINAIPESSGTCFDCGIKMANDLLASDTRSGIQKIIILMTDGIADDTYKSSGDPENNGMREAINGVNRQNIIYDTIGIGDPINDVNEAYLRQLANANGGKYYNDPTNGQLVTIFNEIANGYVGNATVGGTIFNDRDANKVKNGAEGPLANWTVTLTGGILTKPLTTTSNASGNYSFNVLCDGTYTITESVLLGWLPTTTTTYLVNSSNGGFYNNFIFGDVTANRISGNIFDDHANFGIFDPNETLHAGSFIIIASQGKVTTKPDGTYVVNNLYPGPVTVWYVSLPSGYSVMSPRNGPPPSYKVIVGPNCTTNGAPGAVCLP